MTMEEISESILALDTWFSKGTVKWKLRVLWRVSCVGWCFLGQTCEGVFSRSRHRKKDVLLEQICKRTCDEGFFANNMHALVLLMLCS